MRGGRPTLSVADGNFTVAPTIRIDTDFGSFWDQNAAGGYGSGAQVRRARLGAAGTVMKDMFSWAFTWDFAPSVGAQVDGGKIFEGYLNYNVTKWATMRAGVYTILHTLEWSTSSFELLFMERASIISLVTSLGSGDTRYAAGAELRGADWFVSGYATDGVASTLHDGQQRAAVGRGIWVPVKNQNITLQVGIDGLYQWKPGTQNNTNVRLRDYPEIRISPLRFLDTRAIASGPAWSLGGEVSGLFGPVLLTSEYYAIKVNADVGGERGFNGWYVALSTPLIGKPRVRNERTATWTRPQFEWLNPNAGTWGWLEAAARYSFVDLNDAPTFGGKQGIWEAALNWYPTRNLHFTLQYMNGKTYALPTAVSSRRFQAVGLRLSFNL